MLKRKITPDAPAPRPALHAIEPFGRLSRRWADLTERQEALLAEMRPLAAAIRGAADFGGAPARREAPADYPPAVAAQIADVLPFKRPGPAPADGLDETKRRAAEIGAELESIMAAKRHLQPALERGRAQASAAIIDAVRLEYNALARQVAHSLRNLGEAWSAARLFERDLAAEGVSLTTLQRIDILDPSDGRDALALIGRALQRAAEAGFIDVAEIPVEWMVR